MQICSRRSRSNRFTSSTSFEVSANVSTRLRPQGKSTTASPIPGISHHGERGSGASTMKLRSERSRNSFSARARRPPGFGVGLEDALALRAQEVHRVAAQEQPVHLAIDRDASSELAQLLALGGGPGREAHPRAAHEDEERGPDRVGRREQRPVLQVELQVADAQLEAAHAERLRPERQVDEAVHLSDFLARDDPKAGGAPFGDAASRTARAPWARWR